MQTGYCGKIELNPGTRRNIFPTENNPGGADLTATQKEVATILNNGNFGLGVTNPIHTLDVYTSTLSTSAKITNAKVGNDTLLHLKYAGSVASNFSIGILSDVVSSNLLTYSVGGDFRADYMGVHAKVLDNI